MFSVIVHIKCASYSLFCPHWLRLAYSQSRTVLQQLLTMTNLSSAMKEGGKAGLTTCAGERVQQVGWKRRKIGETSKRIRKQDNSGKGKYHERSRNCYRESYFWQCSTPALVDLPTTSMSAYDGKNLVDHTHNMLCLLSASFDSPHSHSLPTDTEENNNDNSTHAHINTPAIANAVYTALSAQQTTSITKVFWRNP